MLQGKIGMECPQSEQDFQDLQRYIALSHTRLKLLTPAHFKYLGTLESVTRFLWRLTCQ